MNIITWSVNFKKKAVHSYTKKYLLGSKPPRVMLTSKVHNDIYFSFLLFFNSLLIFIVGMNDRTMGFFLKKMANGPYFSHSLSNSIFALEWFRTADVKSTSIISISADLCKELLCPSSFIYWLMMTHFCTFKGKK